MPNEQINNEIYTSNNDSDLFERVIPFSEHDKIEEVISSYNLSLEKENYIINLEAELTHIKVPFQASINDVGDLSSLEKQSAPAPIINMQRLAIGSGDLEIDDFNPVSIFNIIGQEQAYLGGEIKYKQGVGELYIFAGQGFKINGLNTNNIRLWLIAGKIENYIDDLNESISKDKLEKLKYDHHLNAFTILEQGMQVANSEVKLFASHGSCNGNVSGAIVKYFFNAEKESEGSLYNPISFEKCYFKDTAVVEFELPSPNTYLKFLSNIESQNAKFSTKGIIENHGSIVLKNALQIEATKWANFGTLKAAMQILKLREIDFACLNYTESISLEFQGNENLILPKLQGLNDVRITANHASITVSSIIKTNLVQIWSNIKVSFAKYAYFDEVKELAIAGNEIEEVSGILNIGDKLSISSNGDKLLKIAGQLYSGNNIYLRGAQVVISGNLVECSGLLHISVSGKNDGKILLSQYSKLISKHLLIDSVEGDRISKLEIASAKINVDQDALIKAEHIALSPQALLSNSIEIIKSGNYAIIYHEQTCANAALDVKGNLFLNSTKLEISSSSVRVGETIALPNSVTLSITVKTLELKRYLFGYIGADKKAVANHLNEIDLSLCYSTGCQILNKYGFVGKVAKGYDYEYYEGEQTLTPTCYPAAFSAKKVVGAFKKVELGCFNFKEAGEIDLKPKIQSMLASNPYENHALIPIKQFSDQDFKQLIALNPSRQVGSYENMLLPNMYSDLDNFIQAYQLYLVHTKGEYVKKLAKICGYDKFQTSSTCVCDKDPGCIEITKEQQYEYKYKQKYTIKYNCDYDLTYLLSSLEVHFATIVCDPSCQIELVQNALERETGFTDLSSLLKRIPGTTYENIQESVSFSERACSDLKSMFEAAKDFYKVCKHLPEQWVVGKGQKCVVGMPLHPNTKIIKPMIWPSYYKSGENKVFFPAVYLPKEYLLHAPGRATGAFMDAQEWNVHGEEAIIGSGIFGSSGIFGAENLALYGHIIKQNDATQPEKKPWVIEANNMLVTPVVYTQAIGNGQTATFQQTTAGINTPPNEEVYLLIHENLYIRAASLSGKITAEVGKEVIIVPAIDFASREEYQRNGFTKWVKVKHILPTFKGQITIHSVGNQYIAAAEVVGGSEFSVSSEKGKITLNTAIDTELYHKKYWIEEKKKMKLGPINMGSKKTIHVFDTQRLTQVPVGNIYGDPSIPLKSLSVVAFGNLAVYALQAYTKQLYLEAGHNNKEAQELLISSAQMKQFYQETYKAKTSGISFTRGGISFGKSFSSYELIKEEVNVPSRIVVFGNIESTPAYLISNGKYIQLASEIDYKDGNIIISSPLGAYIKSLPNIKAHIIEVKEVEKGIAVKVNKEEAGIELGIKIKTYNSQKEIEEAAISSITAKDLSIIAKEGNLHTKGVMLSYKTALIEALKHIDEPAVKKYFESIKQKEGGLFVKLGFRSSLNDALENTKAVKKSKVKNAVSFINAASKYYNAFTDWVGVIVSPIQGGLYISGKFKEDKLQIREVVPVVSEYNGEELKHKVDSLVMKGSKVSGVKWYVDAKEIMLSNAFSSYEQHSNSKVIQTSFSIFGSTSSNLNVVPISTADGKVYKCHLIDINLGEELVFNVAGPVAIQGGNLEAEKILINATSLIIKSVHNIYEAKGDSINIGTNIVPSIEQVFNSIGGYVERRDARWVEEITKVIGREKVEIILSEALSVVGAVVANAERDENDKLTDKGQLHIKASEIFVENLYSYDNGYTLGASFTKASEGGIFGSSYGAKFGYSKETQTTKSAIGEGEVEGKVHGKINRDINDIKSDKKGYKLETVDIKFQSVDVEKVQEKLNPDSYFERVYVESGLAATFKFLQDTAYSIKEGVNNLFESDPEKTAEEEIAEMFAEENQEGRRRPKDNDDETVNIDDEEEAQGDDETDEQETNLDDKKRKHKKSSEKEDGRNEDEKSNIKNDEENLDNRIEQAQSTTLTGAEVLELFNNVDAPEESLEESNPRIREQEKEAIKDFFKELGKSEARGDYIVYRTVDQNYIIFKHGVKAVVLMGKKQFAKAFPDTYDKLAGYSDKLEEIFALGINKVDGKLTEVFGSVYDGVKSKCKDISAGFDKYVPEILQDQLMLFTMAGVSKVADYSLNKLENIGEILQSKKRLTEAGSNQGFEKLSIDYPENIVSYERLKEQLLAQEAASIFTMKGGLKQELIDTAIEVKLKEGIKNSHVVTELTKDGSKLEDWGKFTTRDINTAQGKMQIHFYKNKVTGEVNYNIDYKAKPKG